MVLFSSVKYIMPEFSAGYVGDLADIRDCNKPNHNLWQSCHKQCVIQ